MRVEAFLALEATTSATLKRAWRSVGETFVEEVRPLLDQHLYAEAHALADAFVLRGILDDHGTSIQRIATSAFLFGASNVAGHPADTSFVNGEAVPAQLQQAVSQLRIMIEDNGADSIRDALHDLIMIEEKAFKDQFYKIEKASLSLADRLNAAVLGTGGAVIDVGANLTTSRLVNLGFLAEAMNQKIRTYQVNEVLDSRTCPVCRYMHGKEFKVSDEYARTFTVLGTTDPNELKGLAPWPKQSKSALSALFDMSASQMQNSGYGSPPYHPLCRGVLALTGTVTEEIPAGMGNGVKELVALLDGTKGPAEVGAKPAVTTTLAAAADLLSSVADPVWRAAFASFTDTDLMVDAIKAYNKGQKKRLASLFAKAGVPLPS